MCNSLSGELPESGVSIMDLGYFLGGIGAVGSIMNVGGSPQQLARDKRDDAQFRLYFVDCRERRLLLSPELGRLGNVLDVLTLGD